MPGVYKNVLSNSLILLFGSFFAGLFLFLFNVLLARLLSVEEFGIALLVISVFSFFILVFEFGIGNATTKFVAEFAKQNKKLSSIIVSSAELFAIFSIISTLILFLSSEFISRTILKNDITIYLQIISLGIIFALIVRFAQCVLLGFQEMKHSTAISIVNSGLRLAVPLFLLLLGLKIFGVVVGVVLGAAVAGIFSILVSLKYLKDKGIKLEKTEKMRQEMLSYGLLMYLPFLGIYLMPSLLNLLVGGLGSVSNVSYFAVSMTTTNLLFLFLMPLSLALLPMTADMYANANKRKEIALLGNTFLRYSLLASFVVIIFLTFFSSEILSIFYGKNYGAAGLVLSILSIAVFFETMRIVADPLLNATNNAKNVSKAELIKFLAIILVGFLLIPSNGIIGAAIAVLVAYIISNLLKLFYIKRMGVSLISAKIHVFIILVLLLALFLIFKQPFYYFIILFAVIIIFTKVVTLNELKLIKEKIFK